MFFELPHFIVQVQHIFTLAQVERLQVRDSIRANLACFGKTIQEVVIGEMVQEEEQSTCTQFVGQV
jgi:hypothetical protein